MEKVKLSEQVSQMKGYPVDYPLAKRLLDAGYPVDIGDREDQTAAFREGEAGSIDAILFLFAHGANVAHVTGRTSAT
eukprot:4379628-Prymnesium_polylepis.1